MIRPSAILLCTGLALPASAATFDCVMDPAVTVNVGAPVPGLLEEILISRGQEVRKGDIIARLRTQIDDTTIELIRMQAENTDEVEMHRSRLELALKVKARVDELMQRQVTAQERADEAEASVKVASAELAIAETQRELLALQLQQAITARDQKIIRSPIDGIVVERTMYGGEYVTQDSHVATLAQLDPLHVEAYLPVSLYPVLALDQQIPVHPAEPIGGAYQARITAIDRVFDAASGTFGIRLALDNPGSALPAGHRCTLDLPGDDG